ncbi:LacI family DNA-binding transcriptional regulator [Brevibacillus sp. B_LB10_24]|uniref:LacI family DNA-binding transcriptional regulator n=1 Tax=Brevibacillus sp. B_LB10_24 TaxID=3380645 RepID=UPI0038BD3972
MRRKTSKTTIKDVAEHAGVSTTTISRYLNGRYEAMSSDTRERIRHSIEMLDFKPNQLARGLRNERSNTIGFVVADISNPYSVSVIQGFEETCAKLGYSLMVCNANEDPEKESECLRMLDSRQIDGLIINSTGKNNDLLFRLSKSIPVLLIDRKLPEMPFDTVTTNNVQGMHLAISHLQEKQCNHISLLIAHPEGISPRYERVVAFEQFARALHDVRTSLKIIHSYRQELVTEHIKDLVTNREAGERIGLILGNGKLSLSALKAVHELKCQVPRELLLIGFDDPEWASIARPTLTVVAQPTYEIGRQAAEIMISRITKNEVYLPKTVELAMRLVSRESTDLSYDAVLSR